MKVKFILMTSLATLGWHLHAQMFMSNSFLYTPSSDDAVSIADIEGSFGSFDYLLSKTKIRMLMDLDLDEREVSFPYLVLDIEDITLSGDFSGKTINAEIDITMYEYWESHSYDLTQRSSSRYTIPLSDWDSDLRITTQLWTRGKIIFTGPTFEKVESEFNIRPSWEWDRNVSFVPRTRHFTIHTSELPGAVYVGGRPYWATGTRGGFEIFDGTVDGVDIEVTIGSIQFDAPERLYFFIPEVSTFTLIHALLLILFVLFRQISKTQKPKTYLG